MKRYEFRVRLETDNRWDQNVTVEAYCWNGAAAKAQDTLEFSGKKKPVKVTKVHSVTRLKEVAE